MFSKALTSVAAIALLATAVKADYSIVEPVDGTKWVPGETVTISWIEIPGTATPEKLSLALMVGEATLLQVSQTIADVDSSAGTYKWTVPNTIQPGTLYAVRAGSGDVVKYSHYFDVQAGKEAQASVASAEPAATSASETPSTSTGTNTGTSASSKTSEGTSVSTSTSSVSASAPVASSGSSSSSGSSKVSVPSSASSPSSTAAGTSTKASTAAPSSSNTTNKTSTTAPGSAGNTLAISGIAALIPAALVAFMRQ